MALLDIKEGDRVFCINFGWGTVRNLCGWMDFPIEVNFDNDYTDCYSLEGKLFDYMIPTLSFKEYTIEGFSQERPEDLPEEGQIVWVKDENDEFWQIGHFWMKSDDRYLISSGRPGGWNIMGNQITTKNPYEK
jgi:hypothetical protein